MAFAAPRRPRGHERHRAQRSDAAARRGTSSRAWHLVSTAGCDGAWHVAAHRTDRDPLPGRWDARPGRRGTSHHPRLARLVVLNHASNVMGTILPVDAGGRAGASRGALLLVDAAQTAGAMPIDMQALGIDLLAFTGHKALLGPPGTGGLAIGEGWTRPLWRRCCAVGPAAAPSSRSSPKTCLTSSRAARRTGPASQGWARACASCWQPGSRPSATTSWRWRGR